MKPIFIVLLGGEGSGKSSMLEHAKTLYPDISFTREPGGSPHAEIIRQTLFHPEYGKDSTPETQFFLNWASRMSTMSGLIVPTLKSSRTVISDRGDCCTFAYQIFGGERPDLEDLFWKIRDQLLIPKPDLYIFFDVDIEAGLARASARKTGNNFFDEKKLPFHQRVNEGYKKFLTKVPHEVIDANQSLEDVKSDFSKLLSRVLDTKPNEE